MTQDSTDAPVRPDERPLAVVPLFPLPELFLFPGTMLPLHIFEPRYRQMVEDLLDTAGRFVLGTIVPGHEVEMMGTPPVHPVAGLGEIARHERLPDGRYIIFVIGLTRVHLRETPSDRAYRKVEIEPLRDKPVAKETATELRRELVAATSARVQGVKLPKDIPLGQLADLLLLHLKLDAAKKIELYSRLDVLERARGALDHHASQPLPPPKAKPRQKPKGDAAPAPPPENRPENRPDGEPT